MSWCLEEAISHYKSQGAPGDQNALICLLKEIQSQSFDGIPMDAVTTIADSYHIKENLLHALIKRIPSLHLADKHTLMVCSGPNCRKASDLAACAEALCSRKKDTVTLRFVPCMRMCGKGPNIKWDGVIYNHADPELLQKLLK